MKTALSLFISFWFAFTSVEAQSGKATWIWYPGDLEVWLHNKVSMRREERNRISPPFWKLDAPYQKVAFTKEVQLNKPEDITIKTEGEFILLLDGKYQYKVDKRLTVPEGKHTLTVQVANFQTVPALFVQGTTIVSDNTWQVTQGNGIPPVAAGHWQLNEATQLPSHYQLATKEQAPAKAEKKPTGWLLDFGRETFGYVVFHNLKGKGQAKLYYGESKEEALSPDSCEVFDTIAFDGTPAARFVISESKAFRYVNIVMDKDLQADSVSMLYEYLPLVYKGRFSSSNEKLNRIWDVAAYTLHLNTREFFLDGIKRDRWVWSGDAYQSFLMNDYLFFDEDVARRTLFALRGKDPVQTHINTILDYSFYWFNGIYDHFLYTGDTSFVQQIYPRMQTLMDFCLNRRNNNGMVEGLPGDWVFIDWAPMEKEGENSFEQVLFARSLDAMALCAGVAGDLTAAKRYQALATDLKQKTFSIFWDEQQHALVNNRKDGQLNRQVTRYANMFAMMYGYLDAAKIQDVKQHVLLNRQVQKITTPYMRFYELAALCQIGEHNYVLKEMLDYWGGMLDLGATSFWEQFDPAEKGREHLAMYGRPYGRSLCHAWGASPLYLLGKYFLGVEPTSGGYKTHSIAPHLGGLQWMEGKVPIAGGKEVDVYQSTTLIKVKTGGEGGLLQFRSKKRPHTNSGTFINKGSGQYELQLIPGKQYIIRYQNME